MTDFWIGMTAVTIAALTLGGGIVLPLITAAPNWIALVFASVLAVLLYLWMND